MSFENPILFASGISTEFYMHTEDSGSLATRREVFINGIDSYDDLAWQMIVIQPVVSSSTSTYQETTLDINRLGEKPLCPPVLATGGGFDKTSSNYPYAIKVDVPYMVTYVPDQDVFLLVNPQWTSATTSRRGIVQLNNTVTSTSTSAAATPNAVKVAYEHADSAHAKADSITSEKLPAKADLVNGKVPSRQLPEMNYDAKGSAATVQTALNNHTTNQSNPHKVSASDVGLGNVNNTSDANKPISTAVQTALNAKAPVSHASAAESYGTGSGSNYGHVKLSDSYSSTSGAGSGIAATPSAVKSAYDLAASKVTVKSVNVSLTTSGWSGSRPYTQSVTASGVTSSNYIVVGIGASATASQVDAAAAANLLATSQSANSVKVTAYGTKPTVAIPLSILILG